MASEFKDAISVSAMLPPLLSTAAAPASANMTLATVLEARVMRSDRYVQGELPLNRLKVDGVRVQHKWSINQLSTVASRVKGGSAGAGENLLGVSNHDYDDDDDDDNDDEGDDDDA
ncbi:hypothetical protein EDD21DRAFT_349578 [Dissophora ornata]|nr:hypothetical protein EDD21DRAFT_349578 [Dissophora ornata]